MINIFDSQMRLHVFVNFVLAGLLPLAAAFYDDDSAVRLIEGRQEFEEKVLKSEEVAVVEFYAPWCPHCKSLVPVMEETAKALEVQVSTALHSLFSAEQKLTFLSTPSRRFDCREWFQCTELTATKKTTALSVKNRGWQASQH